MRAEAPHEHRHAHGTASSARRRRLALALALTALYMLAEVAGGLFAGSLALLSDANHMLSDAGALGLALFAAWFASRPSGARWTYGRARAEILAALAQGVALVVVAVLIAVEAAERFGAPQPVRAGALLGVASGGLVVNLVVLALLRAGRERSLNLRAAWLHVLGDAAGSAGAMVAGAAIWAFGWTAADPLAALAICVLVLYSAWQLCREAIDVLMETAPRGVDVESIRLALGELPGVSGVHDLHVWTVGSEQLALSCHLVVPEDGRCTPMLTEVYTLLGTRFAIDHATVQLEPVDFAGETPLSICAGCDERAGAGAGAPSRSALSGGTA
jgi:cobalt-zinc-cadmium efflux system protein